MFQKKKCNQDSQRPEYGCISKRILITGGTDGIGLALAQRLLKDGHQVLVTGRNFARLQAALHSCPGLKGLKSDVTIKKERMELIQNIRQQFGKLDVLINNAGIGNGYHFFSDGAETLFEQEINTNLLAPALLIYEILPYLDRPANIINVTSGYALWPGPCLPGYSASKAGLSAFTSVLQEQVRMNREDIHVMEVCPPMVDTSMTSKVICAKISAEQVADQIACAITSKPKKLLIGLCKVLDISRRISPGLTQWFIRRWPIPLKSLPPASQ